MTGYTQGKDGRFTGSRRGATAVPAAAPRPTRPPGSRTPPPPTGHRTSPPPPPPPGSSASRPDVTAHLYEKYTALRTGDSTPKTPQKCPDCGQFSAGEGHDCRMKQPSPQRKIVNAAVATVGTFAAVGAAAVAGPAIAAALVVGSLAITFLLLRYVKKEAKESRPQLVEEARQLQTFDPDYRQMSDDITDLKERLNVSGDIVVVPYPNGGHGASAARHDAEFSVIYVSRYVAQLPPAQRKAILAHEITHLQRNQRSAARIFASRAAFPVAVTAGAVTGAAFLPAAIAGASAWWATKLVQTARSRAEERRADREAHKLYGELYEKAITDFHHDKSVKEPANLPWRTEDLFGTHPSLQNRLVDMRKR